jgi:hypothetical protein
MEPQTVGHNIEPKERGDRFGEGIVEKFAERETRRMQAERQSSTRNEDAANLRQRSLNVHIRERNHGNHAIESRSLKWQALAGAKLIGAVWKSYLGSSQPRPVDINSRYFLASEDTP